MVWVELAQDLVREEPEEECQAAGGREWADSEEGV